MKTDYGQLSEGQFETEKEGYHVYWNYAKKKGYSGTAVFSKELPLSVTYGIGMEEHDQEGRVIVCGDLNVAHQEIDLKNPKTGAYLRRFISSFIL